MARIRETPAEAALADLTVSLGGPLPEPLRRPDLPERTADLLEWVWAECVLPYWPRRRRVLQADVIARMAQLSQAGWAAALNDMRPGMRWLGDGRLQINAYDYPPRKISGAQLLFVPVTPRQGWASWDEPHRYAVVYPCSGVLAEADRVAIPETLAALLGPARAGILVLLDTLWACRLTCAFASCLERGVSLLSCPRRGGVPGGGSSTRVAVQVLACRVSAHRPGRAGSRGCSETRGGRGPGSASTAGRAVPTAGADPRRVWPGEAELGLAGDDQPGPMSAACGSREASARSSPGPA